MITGVVDQDGHVVAGTGFALERTGPGVYAILFFDPAPDIPVVLVTPSETDRIAAAAASPAGAEVTLTDRGGVPAEGGFSFAVLP